jgi:hypothetical protein
MDIVRHQVRASLEWKQGLFITGQFPQRFAHQVTGTAIGMDQGAASLECAKCVFAHSEFQIALGFFDGPSQK